MQNALWNPSRGIMDELFIMPFLSFFFLICPLLDQINGHFVGEWWDWKMKNQNKKKMKGMGGFNKV